MTSHLDYILAWPQKHYREPILHYLATTTIVSLISEKVPSLVILPPMKPDLYQFGLFFFLQRP